MRSLSRIAAPALALVALAFTTAGCKEEVVHPIVVTVSASPEEILNDGVASTTITVTATDSQQLPAVGDVTLNANAGFFDGSDRVGRGLITLVNGTATSTFTCSKAKSAGCMNQVVIAVSYEGVTENVTVKIADVAEAKVTLASDKTDLVAGLGSDQARLTITVKRAGQPLAAETVQLKASAGEFEGGRGDTIDLETDASGIAHAIYLPGTLTVPSVTINATAADAKAAPLTLNLNKPKVKVTAAAPVVYAGVGQLADIDLQLQSASDADLRVAADLEVTTTHGDVEGTSPPAKTATVTTDAEGKARVRIALATVDFGTAKKLEATVSVKVKNAAIPGGEALGTGSGKVEIRQVLCALQIDKLQLYSGVGDSARVTLQLKDGFAPTTLLSFADVPIDVAVAAPPAQTGAMLQTGGQPAAAQVRAVTDAQGKAELLLSAAALEEREVTVTAGLAPLSAGSQKIFLRQPTLKLTSLAKTLVGSIDDATIVEAQLVHGTSSLSFAQVPVAFANLTSFGTLADAAAGTLLGNQASVSTDAGGIARIKFVATGANQATATATQVQAQLVGGTPVVLQPAITVEPLELVLGEIPPGVTTLFNGVGESTTIQAAIRGKDGQLRAKAGIPLKFEIDKFTGHGFEVGASSPQAVVNAQTGADGLASVTFAPFAGDTAATATVKAALTLSGKAANNTVVMTVARPALVEPNPSDTLVVGAGRTKSFTFQLKRSKAAGAIDLPKAGVDVRFTVGKVSDGAAPTTAGIVNGTGQTVTSLVVKTDAFGAATVTVNAGSNAEAIKLNATAAGIEPAAMTLNLIAANVQMSLINGAPELYNGLGQFVELQAQLVDNASTPLSIKDADLTFVTSSHALKSGAGTATKVTLKSDADGRAVVRFLPVANDLSALAKVTVGLGTAPTTTVSQDLKVMRPRLAFENLISALPSAVGMTAPVVARILDASGNPIGGANLSGVDVTFRLTGSLLPPTGFVQAGPPSTVVTSLAVPSGADGYSRAEFTPGVATGNAQLEISANGMTTATGTIKMLPVVVTLSSPGTSLHNGVGDALVVTGKLMQVDGTASTALNHPGVGITFVTDFHGFAGGQKTASATSDGAGTATAAFTPVATDAAPSAQLHAYVTAAGAPTQKTLLKIDVLKPAVRPLQASDTRVIGVGARKDYTFQLKRGASDLNDLARTVALNFAVTRTAGGPATTAGLVDGGAVVQSLSKTTDAAGRVTVSFDPGSTVENVVLTASAPAIDAGTVALSLIQPGIQLTADKSVAYNGLDDVIQLTAQLLDNTNTPVAAADASITFTTTAHRLEAGAIGDPGRLTLKTDSNGKAMITLVPQTDQTATKVTVKAGVGAVPTTFPGTIDLDVLRPKLQIVGALPTIPTAVGATADLKVKVVSPTGGSIPLTLTGREVLFKITNGLLPPTGFFDGNPPQVVSQLAVLTNSAGEAQVTFTPGNVSGPAQFEAGAPGMDKATGAVTVLPVNVKVTPLVKSTVYNGIDDSVEFKGEVQMINAGVAQPLPSNLSQDIEVVFETTTHFFANGATSFETRTAPGGVALATFKPSISKSETEAQVSAYVKAAGKAPVPVPAKLTIQNLLVTVTSTATSLTTGLGQTATITAQLKSGTTVAAVKDVELTFSTNLGGFLPGDPAPKSLIVKTDSNGQASATFTTNTETGDAVVSVGRPGVTAGSVNIKLNGIGLNVSASPGRVPVNVGDSALVTAQLTDNGQPRNVAGVAIRFVASSHRLQPIGGGALVSQIDNVLTDSTGRAQVRFVPESSDSTTAANVTATAQSATASAKIDVARLSFTVTTSAATLTAGIDDSSTITAQLMDGAIPFSRAGIETTLTTTLGQLESPTATGSPITVATDASGKAIARLLAGNTAGPTTVKAERTGFTPGSVAVTIQPVTVRVLTDKSALYMGVGDSTGGTIELSSASGALAQKQVTLVATNGLLQAGAPGVGAPAASVVLTTDSTGKARFTLTAGASTDNATLTATFGSASGSATLTVRSIDEVQFVGQAPIMGVKGSGINETAQLQFKVLSGGTAVGAGLGVNFQITQNTGIAPSQTAATLGSVTGLTGNGGTVTVTVRSGTIAGPLKIAATCAGRSTETQVPVYWNRPTADRMELKCEKLNLDVYNTSNPPKAINVPCYVVLAERSGGVLQVDTVVQFLSEGGAQPPSVTLAKGTSDGKVNFVFMTDRGTPQFPVPGGPLPARLPVVDYTVTPAYTVFPARPEEPRIGGNHPRGRYVTLIAYTLGEEEFADSNNNGVWDPGEPFIDELRYNGVYDAPEPFVDMNGNGVRDNDELFLDVDGDELWTQGELFIDLNGNGVYDNGEPFTDALRYNGVWDPGELFTDANENEAWDGPEVLTDLGEPFVDANDNGWWDKGEPFQDINGDGQWTPPNGRWDQVTGIWQPIVFVYTGAPTARLSPNSESVPLFGTRPLTMEFLDGFSNPPATTTTFTVSRTGSRGSFTTSWSGMVNGSGNSATMKDGFGGSGPLRKKVGLRFGSTCGGAGFREPVCVWKTYFDSWTEGFIGTINLAGATKEGDAENATFTITGVTNGSSNADTTAVVFE